MRNFLVNFGTLSMITAFVGCGVYAPHLAAPLVIWFVLTIIYSIVEECRKNPKAK